MSDTFGKGPRYDAFGRDMNPDYYTDISVSQKYAGLGIKAHADGYNLLHGDHHVSWFGDPQRKIIHHGMGQGGKSFIGFWYVTQLCNNYYYGWNFSANTSIEGSTQATSSNAIWHEFDVANKVDVGVK